MPPKPNDEKAAADKAAAEKAAAEKAAAEKAATGKAKVIAETKTERVLQDDRRVWKEAK